MSLIIWTASFTLREDHASVLASLPHPEAEVIRDWEIVVLIF